MKSAIMEKLNTLILSSIQLDGFDEFASRAVNGKRVRAGLVLALAGKTDDTALKVAASVELLHFATMIHDDVIDNSKKRRSQQAMHVAKGVKKSVLYGDHVLSRALALVCQTGRPVLWELLTRAVSEVVAGELREQALKYNATLSQEFYFEVTDLKTGTLFSIPAFMAGELAGHAPEVKDRLRSAASSLAAAYQIIDDILDYVDIGGDKDQLRDLSEGLATLPFIKCREAMSGRELEEFCRAFSGIKDSPDAVVGIKDKVLAGDAIGDCLSMAAFFLERSLGEFESSGISREKIEDIFDGMWEKIKYAKEKHRDSRGRVCRM